MLIDQFNNAQYPESTKRLVKYLSKISYEISDKLMLECTEAYTSKITHLIKTATAETVYRNPQIYKKELSLQFTDMLNLGIFRKFNSHYLVIQKRSTTVVKPHFV